MASRPSERPGLVWTPKFIIAVIALAGLIAMLGLYGSSYILAVASQIAIFAIVVLGLNLLVGFGGQISFGHNAFFGIGGYIAAVSTTSWGLHPALGALLGAILAGVVAAIIGFPTLRLRGHFLALGTFAVGLGFYAFAVSTPFFNGFSGIGGIPPFSISSFAFDQQYLKFWLCGAVLVLSLIAVSHLREGRWGRALRTMSSDEATAASIGINVHGMKLKAFVISALFASVAGSLYAYTVSYVSPETFSFATILTFFMMLFIGGVKSVWGAVLGATIVTVIPELVPTGVAAWQPTIFAVLLVLVLILRPIGILAGKGGAQSSLGLQFWSRVFGKKEAVR
jgi:branched-chain amino acid transport system permease protein